MSQDWFSFQRYAYSNAAQCFQSPELTRLFLEKAEIRISAAWCISRLDKRLIYFWGDVERYRAKADAMGSLAYCLSRFGPFFEQLREHSSLLLSDALFETAASDPIKFVASKSIGLEDKVEIYAGSNYLYVYLLHGGNNDAAVDMHLRSYLLDRSERGYEISRLAESFFERIPKQILNVSQSPNTLLDQFFGPSRFSAIHGTSDCFAWPWQRCQELRDQFVKPKEILTISLVMDLRNSSSAMLLTREASNFSMFIDRVVEESRAIITQNGGYFDKDTGDGVVAHFEAPNNWDTGSQVLVNVLTAACEISRCASRHCRDYQDNLVYRLRGLGCAIGLFAGKAVWLYSWSGIRGVGSSVVNAARICSNALPGEIGYCNQLSKLIREHGIGSDVLPEKSETRAIKVSEVREAAIPEATFVQVS